MNVNELSKESGIPTSIIGLLAIMIIGLLFIVGALIADAFIIDHTVDDEVLARGKRLEAGMSDLEAEVELILQMSKVAKIRVDHDMQIFAAMVPDMDSDFMAEVYGIGGVDTLTIP